MGVQKLTPSLLHQVKSAGYAAGAVSESWDDGVEEFSFQAMPNSWSLSLLQTSLARCDVCSSTGCFPASCLEWQSPYTVQCTSLARSGTVKSAGTAHAQDRSMASAPCFTRA